MKAPSSLSVCFVGAFLLLPAGCERRGGDPATEETEAARFGGTAVIAGLADLQTMNSLVVNQAVPRMFQTSVLFLPLLGYDARFDVVPVLAEAWDTARIAADTLEITFRLRRGVQWHDGHPVDARDVAFTYERVRDPQVASALAAGFAYYSPRMVVVDDHTVRLRLRPHSDFLDGWTQLAIMPAHLLSGVPPQQLATHPFGTESPVGNGPFRFASRVPGQSWTFEANPDFPAALGGRPYLDRLVYRVIPDQTTLLTELLTGGVDLYLAVNPAQARQIGASREVEVRSSPSFNSVFIGWNGRLPMFDSPEERRALSMAIDRAALVSSLLGGHGAAGRSTVTPAHWAWDASDAATTLPYSREAARELLARAGWLDRDGDGTLEDGSGRPFRFSLKTVAGNQPHHDAAQIVQSQLRGLGIDVQVSAVEARTLIAQIVGHRSPAGDTERDYQAVVMGLEDRFRKDDAILFHSRNLGGPMQISSFSDPRVDLLLDTIGLVLDREQARPLWREYQKLMVEQAPHTVLFYPDRLAAVRTRLRGVEIDARGELPSVNRWWIAPAERGTPRSAARGGS